MPPIVDYEAIKEIGEKLKKDAGVKTADQETCNQLATEEAKQIAKPIMEKVKLGVLSEEEAEFMIVSTTAQSLDKYAACNLVAR